MIQPSGILVVICVLSLRAFASTCDAESTTCELDLEMLEMQPAKAQALLQHLLKSDKLTSLSDGTLPEHMSHFLSERLCNGNIRPHASNLQSESASTASRESTLKSGRASAGGLLSTAEHALSVANIGIGGGLGSTAPLSEVGYRRVATEADEKEMRSFVRRVAESCNLEVVNEGGLNGAAPWFLGANKSGGLENLKSTLFSALLSSSSSQWVGYKTDKTITANSSAPDAIGYVQVRALRNRKEMKTFVRRLLEEDGIKVVDEGGFEGMMRFYSDPYDFQSYASLQKEIKNAANERKWAVLE